MCSQEQHIESRRRQRFVGKEARRHAYCRAHLLHVGTEVRPYPGRMQTCHSYRRIAPGGSQDQYRLRLPYFSRQGGGRLRV